MKRIAAAALVLGLMSGTSALAQGDDHHPDRAGPPAKSAGPTKTAGPTHGANPTAQPTQGSIHPGGNGFHTQGGPAGVVRPQGNTLQTQGGPSGFQTQDRSQHRSGQPQGIVVGQPVRPGRPTGANPGNNHRPSFGAPGFRPGGKRPQYNAQFFPRTFNIGQRFQWRGGPWRGPQGYYYRPWGYGQVLPFGWFSAQYYINDYYDYDLPVPPYGYEWIRNGPDALLVDIGNGEVVSSVPGAFY
jgi:Ni/Co efflux regulator RcnB